MGTVKTVNLRKKIQTVKRGTEWSNWLNASDLQDHKGGNLLSECNI